MDSGSQPSTLSRYAWLVVALLMPVALLNYLDRQMLASMRSSIVHDIPTIVGDHDWGVVLALFKWVYAIFSILGGYVADRFSRRWVICSSLLVWSAITWLTAHTNTYYELLAARSLMGISEAFYIPAALALIADYHTGDTRSRAVGLHQIAIYGGVILGGFGGYVADSPDLGWRFAFIACGVVGIAYSLPLFAFLRDAPASRDTANEVRTSVGRSMLELATNTSFILLVLYFALPAIAGWIIRDWMPAILKDEFDIAQGKAGLVATIYWQGAAILGALGGGWLADRWMRHSDRGRIYVSALGMCMLVPAVFGLGYAGTLGVAVAFLILFGLGWGFFDSNNMPILSQIVRPHLRATGYGIMNFVSISCGGVADWVFGKLRDDKVPLSMIFGVAAGAALVSIVLVLLIRPKRDLKTQ